MPEKSKRRSSPKSKADRQSTEKALRSLSALDLRIAGKGYREIGEVLGTSTTTAYTDVMNALRDTLATRAEKAVELRQLEIERLDKMLDALWSRAVGKDSTRPNVALIDRVLRIMERRAKLCGLDAPVTQITITPEQAAQLSDAALERFRAGEPLDAILKDPASWREGAPVN